MNATPVFQIEREPWGAASILKAVNVGVYICSCSFRSDEYMCKTKHAFVYNSHFKQLHQSNYCGDLIDNISDAPNCVLEDKDRETNLNFRRSLKIFSEECALWNMSTK